MKHHDIELPLNCQNALRAIESDPLNLPQDTLKHISTCPMCSETRVMWIAQEDFDHPLVPAEYFDRLPSRVFQKLPALPKRLRLRLPLLISAASIMFIVAGSSYWIGKQNQSSTVVLEALMPPKDLQDHLQDFTSFTSIELYAQVPNLTPEEIQALMRDLKKPEVSVQRSEPAW
jgi:hypothetical protein